MEQDPSDPNVAIAEAVCEQIEVLLEQAQYIGIASHATFDMGPNHCLELKVNGNINGPRGLPDSRYVYIFSQVNDTPNLRAMQFSLNLDSLQSVEGPDGLYLKDIVRSYDVDTISNPEVREFIDLIHLALGAQGSPLLYDDIQARFTHLLEEGTTQTSRILSRELPDGRKVNMTSHTVEGSLKDSVLATFTQPLIQVAVTRPDELYETVLEQTVQGNFETYSQLADSLERMARLLPSENVTRNEYGEVMTVTGGFAEEQAVIAAERAMGLRDLKAEHLVFIKACVDELVNQA